MTNQIDSAPNERRAERGASAEDAVDMFAVARVAQEVDAAAFAGPGAVKLVAPAKVNLFLDIGRRRPDGYHEAISIMHALMLHDVLRMKLAPARGEGLSIDLSCRSCEGVAPLDVDPEANIVSRAVRLLAQAVGRAVDETLVVNLEKHIPAEAGLGGGSSDAAAALVGTARLWGIDPADPRIEDAARSIGADVAFFLHGGCACFDGVGDTFAHELAPMRSFVVLVKPDGGVSTAEAYRAFDERPEPIDPNDRETALTVRDASEVPLRNNLVPASEALLPVLAEVRAWAEAHEDAGPVLMSGSGSATFVLCAGFEEASRVAADAKARGWWSRATMFGPARAAAVPNR